MISAFFAASAAVYTSKPCASAFAQDLEPSYKPIITLHPLSFAKEFLLDMSEAGGQAHFRAMRKIAAEHRSEVVGEEIRKLYSWNGEDKLINN